MTDLINPVLVSYPRVKLVKKGSKTIKVPYMLQFTVATASPAWLKRFEAARKC